MLSRSRHKSKSQAVKRSQSMEAPSHFFWLPSTKISKQKVIRDEWMHTGYSSLHHQRLSLRELRRERLCHATIILCSVGMPVPFILHFNLLKTFTQAHFWTMTRILKDVPMRTLSLLISLQDFFFIPFFSGDEQLIQNSPHNPGLKTWRKTEKKKVFNSIHSSIRNCYQ